MGTGIIDIWTLGHFLFGVLMVNIIPDYPISSVIIANIIHTIMEMSEKNKNKDVILETTANHVTDSITFFIGSLCGLLLSNYSKKSEIIRMYAFLVSSIVIIQEVGRELFPNKWFYQPAYYS